MPIYEYRCNKCHRRFALFVRGSSTSATYACTRCGSGDITRLLSGFAVLKGEEQRLERLADFSQLGDLDEKDPRSMARWARRAGDEMGEELGPEFDQMVERMEAGEIPDELMGEEEPDEFD